MPEGEEPVPVHERRRKPAELRGLHGVAADLFTVLRDAYDIPRVHTLELYDVDGGTGWAGGLCGWDDIQTVAAIAMVESQALRRAARDDCSVTSAEVVRIATVLHHAIARLTDDRPHGPGTPALLQTRDQISAAARAVTELGSDVYGGVVELD